MFIKKKSICMTERPWKRQPKKIYDKQNTSIKQGKHHKSDDEIKNAYKNEEKLKQKKKRLTLDWFFRPDGD